MWRDDPILKRRPVSAAQRLDLDSRVLLLSLKDALRGLGGEAGALLGCVCEVPHMVAPILRAGRDSDAVLVLSPGAALADRRAAHRFFDLVRTEAETIGTSRPIVLLPSPVRLDARDTDLVAERVHALVDAGYTGLSLHIASSALIENVAEIAKAAEAAVERELGVELLLPPALEEEAGAITGALKLLSSDPDLIGVLGGDGGGLEAVGLDVEPTSISWREGDLEDSRATLALRSALKAGARMVTVRSILTRTLLGGLPKAVCERLGLVPESSMTLKIEEAEALARELDALDHDALDRIEARLYAETEDLISLLRLSGSARAVRQHLEE